MSANCFHVPLKDYGVLLRSGCATDLSAASSALATAAENASTSAVLTTMGSQIPCPPAGFWPMVLGDASLHVHTDLSHARGHFSGKVQNGVIVDASDTSASDDQMGCGGMRFSGVDCFDTIASTIGRTRAAHVTR